MLNWNECKVLNGDELREIVALATDGNAQAIDMLVRSNIKLASKIANNYKSFSGVDTEDLTSEAIMGLIEAIPGYKPEKGTKFSTYATWHMRKRVLAYVIDNFRLVKIGTTQAQRKIFWRLTRETRALQREGLDATDQALADRLQVKTREITEMRIRMTDSETRLDAPINGENAQTLNDVLPTSMPSPETYTTNTMMHAWLRGCMQTYAARLSDTERVIWEHRIAGADTLETTGKIAGCSRQYVHQTERRLHAGFMRYARNQARD